MRTPLAVAVGVLVVAGVVVGVTTVQASSDEPDPVRSIRVEAPAVVDPAVPVPAGPQGPAAPAPQDVPPDPDGTVVPPPAVDDDDDDDGPDDDDDDDDDG